MAKRASVTTLPGTCASLTPSRQGQVRGKCASHCLPKGRSAVQAIHVTAWERLEQRQCFAARTSSKGPGRSLRHFFEEASRLNPEVSDRDRTYLERILKMLDSGELKD